LRLDRWGAHRHFDGWPGKIKRAGNLPAPGHTA